MTIDRQARIRDLVLALDSESTNDAELAQFELTVDFGGDVLEPLLAAAPSFSDFGRLCAIEIFQALADPRAAPVLIPWLRSENHVVRDWAAGTLGQLGAVEAIPELQVAWTASQRRGTPPDWTEPVSIRQALHRLGAREVVLPPIAAGLLAGTGPVDRSWLADRLGAVVRDLASVDQVVMYVQCWRPARIANRDTWLAVTEASVTFRLDWDRTWHELVEDALGQGIAAAETSAWPAGSVVTLEWVDRVDVEPRQSR